MDGKIAVGLGVVITALALMNMYLYYKVTKLNKRVDLLQEGLLDTLDIVSNLRNSLSKYFSFVNESFQEAKKFYDDLVKEADEKFADKPNNNEEEDAVPWE